MAKELKDIGEEYRKASQDSFASVIRSVGEIQGFPGHCFGNDRTIEEVSGTGT